MIQKFKEQVVIINESKLQDYIDFCDINKIEDGEDHHILPKEIFPLYKNFTLNPWNKSTLSIINHIKAHILLCEAIDEKSMVYARNMMLFTRSYKNISEEDFEEIERMKIISREAQSKLMKENNPMKNEETKNKSLQGRKKYFEDGGLGPMTGKKHSDETKKMMSEAHKGKTIKDESKSNLEGYISRYGFEEGTRKYKEDSKKKAVTLEQQIEKYGLEEGTNRWVEINKLRSENASGVKNSFFGKTHSEDMKKYLSEKALNRKKLKCPHCGKEASPAMAKRWHFDNCKMKG